MKHLQIIVTLFISVTLIGCSQNVPLSGKVTFPDGSPLTTGIVCFETDTFLARGTLQPDGTYVIGSLGEKDGLPAGTYRVFIIGTEKEIENSKDGISVMVPLIDTKFTSGATSGLSVDVNGSTKTFDIQVEKP